MGKVRLTKNELKKQKDNLKRFTRYLPTLELKKKQLLQEIRNVQREVDTLQLEYNRVEEETMPWVDVFAEPFDLQEYVTIDQKIIGDANIAGISVPVFEDVIFDDQEPDYYTAPLWIDAAIDLVKEQVRRVVQKHIAQERQEILREELRITIQRIKLFEEVKIPEAKENIRVIQIFLGDLQTAEVVRGKIAKSKIERKKQEAASQ
jgi:V/A-type H+-transporting ATPase subunit D